MKCAYLFLQAVCYELGLHKICIAISSRHSYDIYSKAIEAEAALNGFYAVCTNLGDDLEAIVRVNKRCWEIEECFRIMKTDFEARPVYVQRKDQILAHFITCFIALILYRYLERKLGGKYNDQPDP